jgi:DNA-binding CsgD family transcriptional regulator/PAS domain-containing protein
MNVFITQRLCPYYFRISILRSIVAVSMDRVRSSPANLLLPRLERIWESHNRTLVWTASGVAVAVIALVDWWTKSAYVSMGFLYLFPIMMAAGFLPRWAVALSGASCAALTEACSSPLHPSLTRLSLETLVLAGSGLFVAELVRNRRMILEARDKFCVLVETSPAAIMTVDDHGVIEIANHAAIRLMAPRDGKLVGNPIAAFLPELHHVLRREQAPQWRASMQCQGHRGNDESFTAGVWFSTYKEGPVHKLAAIVADVTDDADVGTHASAPEQNGRVALSLREIDVVRLLVQGLSNKEIAARMEISESAVKNALRLVFTKTGGRTRAQLVSVAFEHYRDDLTPEVVPEIESLHASVTTAANNIPALRPLTAS